MSDKEKVDAEPKTPSGRAFDVAKWLIPSVSALFVIVGYCAQFAHHALIGFDPGLAEPSVYLAATGDFLRWFFGLLKGGLSVWGNAFWEGPHCWLVPLAIFLAIATPISRACLRKRIASGRRCAKAAAVFPACALVLLAVLRLVVFDAPLTRLEGAIVPVATSSDPMPDSPNLSGRLQDNAKQSGISGFIAKRAETLWGAVLCEHHAVPETGAGSTLAACQNGDSGDAQAAVVDGEGLAHVLIVFALIALVAQILLDAPKPPQLVLAWLAVLSCLTLSFTYGKLGHSFEYEFSRVYINDELAPLSTPPSAASAPVATMPPLKAASTPNANVLEGVLLEVNGDWLTLARSEQLNRCDYGVKLWRVSKAEVKWERDIFRIDVLSWARSKTITGCPT